MVIMRWYSVHKGLLDSIAFYRPMYTKAPKSQSNIFWKNGSINRVIPTCQAILLFLVAVSFQFIAGLRKNIAQKSMQVFRMDMFSPFTFLILWFVLHVVMGLIAGYLACQLVKMIHRRVSSFSNFTPIPSSAIKLK